jgi:hypothetical protein
VTGPSGGRDREPWRDYQQPVRWDWSAFAVIAGILLVAVVLAALFLRKL